VGVIAQTHPNLPASKTRQARHHQQRGGNRRKREIHRAQADVLGHGNQPVTSQDCAFTRRCIQSRYTGIHRVTPNCTRPTLQVIGLATCAKASLSSDNSRQQVQA
jgi:hypothetical protein